MSTQFPYPPRSGFEMRVYQLLRQLARRYEVTLLSYGSAGDREGAAALGEELRVEIVERPSISVRAKRGRQIASLAARRPFAATAEYSRHLQEAVDRLWALHRFDAIQVESSQLLQHQFPRDAPLILDEHNIEYELFERMQMGERSLPRRAFYGIEHRRFRSFEQGCWRRVAGCAVTSRRDREIIRASAPSTPAAVVPNGVDLEAFRPAEADVAGPRTVLFNGVLDYRPNLDAAHFLIDEIWPRVEASCPGSELTIVGRASARDLERLGRPGVTLTGEVPDLKPYLAETEVVAVPIRMGGGTRLKVVEAFAMRKAVVSTRVGCEGIAAHDGRHLLMADTPQAFAAAIVRLFEDREQAERLGRAGRKLVEEEYSWDAAGERLVGLYRRVLGERP